MKTLSLLITTLTLMCGLPVLAADQDEKSQAAPPSPISQTPALSDIPKMKEQGKRIAELMEQLAKETNPEIRRRLMSEATCPQ